MEDNINSKHSTREILSFRRGWYDGEILNVDRILSAMLSDGFFQKVLI